MGTTQPQDHVDGVIAAWYAETPTFDRTVKQLAIRLPRVAHYLRRAQRHELSRHDMEVWEFEVLITLRHVGTCTAGDLLRRLGVTSGAISNRLARLEKRGWIQRTMDPADRRQVLVTLTPEGLTRTDEMLTVTTHADERLFGFLDSDTRVLLNDALRAILLAIEGSPVGDEDAPPAERFDVDNLEGGRLLADDL
ncbi:MarR family winged helix-turn-helix transcriptional regulator [Nocardia sp. CA-290969]|uniref:MarR family winged helix-turn-helix transcriptional regulator n=1 Tax=Nocardia sp. CA-290969 TaxID=3239986 RepID=UPI003D939084